MAAGYSPATVAASPHPSFHGRRPPDRDGSNVRPHPVHVQMGNSTVSAPGDSHGGRAPALVGLMGGWVGSVFYVCITDDISHQGKRKLSQPPLVFRIFCVPSFFFKSLSSDYMYITAGQRGKKSMFGMIFRVFGYVGIFSMVSHFIFILRIFPKRSCTLLFSKKKKSHPLKPPFAIPLLLL